MRSNGDLGIFKALYKQKGQKPRERSVVPSFSSVFDDLGHPDLGSSIVTLGTSFVKEVMTILIFIRTINIESLFL